MQVAPMPDKPPFMNGLTAFQVALSFRDMTMRSCGACGDVLRADLEGGAFCVTARTSIARTGGRAREISVVRHVILPTPGLAELAAVFTAGRGEIRGFKPSGRHPSRFASRRDARVWRRTTASDFSGRKKITGRRSCDDRSIRRRVASDESGRALPTRVERTRAREHVARASERGAGRHAFARPRRAREATLDSVSE